MKDEQSVLIWAKSKGIDAPENAINQVKKTCEEVDELRIEIESGNVEAAKMELGDCLVTLTILANQLGSNTDECLSLAYEKIKNRKGKTVDGTFVKISENVKQDEVVKLNENDQNGA